MYCVLFLGVCAQITHGFFLFSRAEPKRTITIMIDPAGDARYTGRKLEDNFERGVSLQIAEQLKRVIEQQFSHVKIISTRLPGQAATPLQYASFANRLNIDFYLSIHCYHEKETKPSLYVYQFSYGDTFITKQFDLALIPYNQAHLVNSSRTNVYGQLLRNALASDAYANIYITKGIYKIPFKPLIGITAPAIALEIGLKNNDDWRDYIDPIAASLAPIIEKLA